MRTEQAWLREEDAGSFPLPAELCAREPLVYRAQLFDTIGLVDRKVREHGRDAVVGPVHGIGRPHRHGHQCAERIASRLLAAPNKGGPVTVCDRSQGNVIQRDVKLVADYFNVAEGHLRGTVTAHGGDWAVQRRPRSWSQQAVEDPEGALGRSDGGGRHVGGGAPGATNPVQRVEAGLRQPK